MFLFKFAPENEGPWAIPYQIYKPLQTVFVPNLIMCLSIAWILRKESYLVPWTNRETTALSHAEVHTGARSSVLGNNDIGLPPQWTEQADTLPGMATDKPTAAPYAGLFGIEQGGRPPSNENNPPPSKIEPEDAPSDFEHVLLLIKQGRLRIEFFPADIQGKWTDRDTFLQIKDHYNCYKSSWWYLNTLSHVEFKKVGIPNFIRIIIA